MYAATRLSITDPLSVILGARISDYSSTTLSTNGARSNQQQNGIVTPYLGAVYDLNDTYSLYASYTDIFSPQSEENASGWFSSWAMLVDICPMAASLPACTSSTWTRRPLKNGTARAAFAGPRKSA